MNGERVVRHVGIRSTAHRESVDVAARRHTAERPSPPTAIAKPVSRGVQRTECSPSIQGATARSRERRDGP